MSKLTESHSWEGKAAFKFNYHSQIKVPPPLV